MTGIEMLRELALDIDGNVKVEWFVAGYDERSRWKGHTLAHELDWIADQIERDQRERYDALNDENERLRDMLNGVSYHLGMGEDVHYYSDERLMPDGYEWPRYEDDELLRVGGEWDAGERGRQRLEALTFDNDGYTLHSDYYDDFRHYGERVKRPSPKVLDADGVEIREGDTVWCTNGHGPFEVTRTVYADRLRVICDDEKNGHLNVYPEMLTHRAHVLAADGKPLEAGQTVWDTNGDELQVLSIEDDHERHVTCHYEGIDGIKANGWWLPHTLTHQRPVLDADGVPIKVGDTVWMVDEPKYSWTVTHVSERHVGGYENEDGSDLDMPASLLTHTKPEPTDSWERIKKDAAKSTCDYLTNGRKKAAIDGTVQCPDDCPGLTLSSTCREIMTADLVRRCKALAGVSE